MFLSCHVRVWEWIHTLYLPEYQGTPCSKQTRNLKFKWLQLDSNAEPFSSKTNTQPFGSEFESSCSHLGNYKLSCALLCFQELSAICPLAEYEGGVGYGIIF